MNQLATSVATIAAIWLAITAGCASDTREFDGSERADGKHVVEFCDPTLWFDDCASIAVEEGMDLVCRPHSDVGPEFEYVCQGLGMAGDLCARKGDCADTLYCALSSASDVGLCAQSQNLVAAITLWDGTDSTNGEPIPEGWAPESDGGWGIRSSPTYFIDELPFATTTAAFSLTVDADGRVAFSYSNGSEHAEASMRLPMVGESVRDDVGPYVLGLVGGSESGGDFRGDLTLTAE